MRKILVGLAFIALISKPALAQDYHKNFRECAKEHGLYLDVAYTHKLQNGRVLRRFRAHGTAQMTAFNDCLARKASLPSEPRSR